jgi:hypothetical protein
MAGIEIATEAQRTQRRMDGRNEMIDLFLN